MPLRGVSFLASERSSGPEISSLCSGRISPHSLRQLLARSELFKTSVLSPFPSHPEQGFVFCLNLIILIISNSSEYVRGYALRGVSFLASERSSGPEISFLCSGG